MKRKFLILLAALIAGSFFLQAEPVSESRAREIAMRVLAAQPATKATSGDVKLIWNGEDAATKAAAQPAFYVFGSDRGGFVIIAGDDNVQPVLAISETNEFMVEGMPANVKWWMDRMKYYVRSASADPEAKEQWAMFAETKSGPITPESSVTDKVERLTPEWDQGYDDDNCYGRHVFNTKCPLDASSNLSITGCVATAIGEVLTCQSGIYGASMPTRATGKAGGYSVPEPYVSAGYVSPALYDLGTEYDWSNLRTLTDEVAIKAVVERGSEADSALLDNLAQLLADVGAMAEAYYSSEGTSAFLEKTLLALGNHMGYNKAAYRASSTDYSPRQWIKKLQNEIDNHPILYFGISEAGGGHAFVFDGYGKYCGQDVFHVNFGWSGSCNGYYYYYNLDTDGDPDYNFSYDCWAWFDLFPVSSPSSPIYNLQYINRTVPGSPPTVFSGLSFDTPFIDDDYFVVRLCLNNDGGFVYEGKLQAKLLDKEDNVKGSFEICTEEDWTDSVSVPIEYAIIMPLKIRLTGSPDISFGDKIVIYCSRDADKTVFAPIKERKDGSVLNSLPIMPAAFIKADPSGYNRNDYFQFELANNDYLYAGTVWKITAPDGTVSSNLAQSSREFQLTQSGTYKIEAAVAPEVGDAVVETITTYITVSE